MFHRAQKTLLVLAGLAALALGGSTLAGAAGKTAKSSASTTTTQSRPSMPQHGTAAHEDQEKPVTGDAAAKAKAAAEKSVGSGSTAGEVTTDFTGDGYEVTVKKADGSTVEVHLDKSFNVLRGHGPCGPPGGPHGDPGGPPPADNSGSGSNSGAGSQPASDETGGRAPCFTERARQDSNLRPRD